MRALRPQTLHGSLYGEDFAEFGAPVDGDRARGALVIMSGQACWVARPVAQSQARRRMKRVCDRVPGDY